MRSVPALSFGLLVYVAISVCKADQSLHTNNCLQCSQSTKPSSWIGEAGLNNKFATVLGIVEFGLTIIMLSSTVCTVCCCIKRKKQSSNSRGRDSAHTGPGTGATDTEDQEADEKGGSSKSSHHHAKSGSGITMGKNSAGMAAESGTLGSTRSGAMTGSYMTGSGTKSSARGVQSSICVSLIPDPRKVSDKSSGVASSFAKDKGTAPRKGSTVTRSKTASSPNSPPKDSMSMMTAREE